MSFFESFFGEGLNIGKRVMGLPLHFSNHIDPYGRVYSKYLENALIVGIIPGRPRFSPATLRQTKLKVLEDILKKRSDIFTENREGFTKDIDNGIDNFIDDGKQNKFADKASTGLNDAWEKEVPKPDREKAQELGINNLKEADLRFYSFKPDIASYRGVLNMLINEVAGKVLGMGLGTNITSYYKNVWEKDHSNGLLFCANGSTTSSESLSNELGETMASGLTKGISNAAREVSYYLGVSDKENLEKKVQDEANKESPGNFASSLRNVSEDIGKFIQDKTAGAPYISSVLKGENLLFPKVWQNSTFDKSYNLSFKFISPYGDRASIFKYVFVPFLALLALAGPIQASADSYKSPFICRLNCPGIMESDMAMVTNMSWVRGTSSNLYSAEGLPLGIDVTMTFTDLYPTMSLASDHALLRSNIGLCSFLDNLAGLSNMQANLTKNAISWAAVKVGSALDLPGVAMERFSDSFAQIFIR